MATLAALLLALLPAFAGVQDAKGAKDSKQEAKKDEKKDAKKDDKKSGEKEAAKEGGEVPPADAAGEPTLSQPGQDGAGAIGQNLLERSNVNVVNELVSLITAQRAYEMNSRAIKVGDEMLSEASNLVR